MAIDDAIFCAVRKGESPPTIRLYEWQPEAVTVGYSQRTDEVIDCERCFKDGVDVAKRPTGGRAVYHKNEIAYSVTASTDDPSFGGNIRKTYRSISAVLCEGIIECGGDAVLSSGKNSAGKHFTQGRISPCFVSSSRYEITVNGKKLVGSAQRRMNNFFLQQGSILTGPGYEKITDYMKDVELAALYKRLIAEYAIDLTTVLNGNFSVADLKASLKNSFQNKLEIELKESKPTDKELETASRIIERISATRAQRHEEVYFIERQNLGVRSQNPE